MDYKVSIQETDGIIRNFHCEKYLDAMSLFHVLTRHYLYVELWKEGKKVHEYDNLYRMYD